LSEIILLANIAAEMFENIRWFWSLIIFAPSREAAAIPLTISSLHAWNAILARELLS
jgi:hypothetical protein